VIGYLGPAGTFSHEALLTRTSGADRLIGFSSITETVNAVEHDEVQLALVPIENSLEGSVNETLDTLVHDAHTTTIKGELVWDVHHCLIGHPGDGIKAIVEVRSHPQALAQCQQYLQNNLAEVRLASAPSTADAVRSALAAGIGYAAVGAKVAATTYGGQVLAEQIEDEAGSQTRFVWLGKQTVTVPADLSDARSTGGKTSVVFSGFDDTAPGGLVSILQEFADRDINLTRIESRPLRTQLGHYMFFVDLDLK